MTLMHGTFDRHSFNVNNHLSRSLAEHHQKVFFRRVIYRAVQCTMYPSYLSLEDASLKTVRLERYHSLNRHFQHPHYWLDFGFDLRKTSATLMTMITPMATITANLRIVNHTEICPKVTANAINPARAANIQNMTNFLSWQ